MPIVLALAGDSTITSAFPLDVAPFSASFNSSSSAMGAAFARALPAVGFVAAVLALAALGAAFDAEPFDVEVFFLVAIVIRCPLKSADCGSDAMGREPR